MQPAPDQHPAVPAGAGGGRTAGAGAVVATVAVGVWSLLAATGTQVTGWFVGQLLLISGIDGPVWARVVPGWVGVLLVGPPAALLARLPRSAAVRATGRLWLTAALLAGVLGSLRAVPPPLDEFHLAALTVLAAAAAVLLRRVLPGHPGRRAAQPGGPAPERQRTPAGQAAPDGDPAPVGAALAGGLVLLLPWLCWGALGGVTGTLLAGTAAVAVGALAGALLTGEPLPEPDPAGPAARRRAPARRHLLLVGGPVAVVALALLAAGVGQDGAQLATMPVLAATGFGVAALGASTTRPALPVGCLVALAAAGPLAFADPEEISGLLVGGRDLPFWVAVATAATAGAALLLGIGHAVTPYRPGRSSRRRWAVALVVGVLLLVDTAGYVRLGQPGWHGEQLFVVLREQADLSGVPTGPNGPDGRRERARAVYRRLVDTAERSQAGLRRELSRLRLSYRPYYLVNAIEVDAGPVVRAWLSRRPEVDRVLLGQRLRPLPAVGPASRGGAPAPTAPPWNITAVHADRVHSALGVTGAGIVVGSSDSGAEGDHPALAAGFRGGDDSWYDPWTGSRSPRDRMGHGTHTLATAVGRRGVGVAPGAHWVACVDLYRDLGSPGRYLDCLQFMLAPFPSGGDPFRDGRPERGPEVLTNSWGCPPIEGCDRRALLPAATALAAAGVFVVAAAGNTGPWCGSIDDPPAGYLDVLTVGAVDRQSRVAEFSARGPAPGGAPKPDLVAPGTSVLSAYPGGTWATASGTSMATPHVAGVVALMWSANPALVGDLSRTRAILRDTAVGVRPTPSPGPRADRCRAAAAADTYAAGAGLVDAYAAVVAARSAG